MRKSVEHLGPQHRTVDIIVSDNVVMRVCPDFEYRRFRFMQDFLRQYGKPFVHGKFPEKYPKGEFSKRCYDQAFDLAKSHGLTYCEGILLARKVRPMFPMPHAWCCDDEGRVVDPTAHKIQGNSDLQYIGVKFKFEYVLNWHKRFGFHGMLDGHPELGDSVGVYVDPVEEWRA